jgi:arylformamidase
VRRGRWRLQRRFGGPAGSGEVFDVSVLVQGEMPIWPDNPAATLERVLSIAHGGQANISELCCGVHTGTHVDAPNHFIEGAGGVDTLDVDALVGLAKVVDMRMVEHVIDAAALSRVNLGDARRVLFVTRNSQLWNKPSFEPDFVSIAPDAARLLSSSGVQLVGIDYLSVGSPETHRVLLGAGVICLEGLDLRLIEPGWFQLFCGPVKLASADGAPARVFLRKQGI